METLGFEPKTSRVIMLCVSFERMVVTGYLDTYIVLRSNLLSYVSVSGVVEVEPKGFLLCIFNTKYILDHSRNLPPFIQNNKKQRSLIELDTYIIIRYLQRRLPIRYSLNAGNKNYCCFSIYYQ